MPIVNQQVAGDPFLILSNYFNMDGWAINPARRNESRFTFQDLSSPYDTGIMTVEGQGFRYQDVGGFTFISGGPARQIRIFDPDRPDLPRWLEIKDFGIDLFSLQRAVLNGESELRDIFAAFQWTWNGSTGDDSFTGGNFADILKGNDGNDLLDGGADADTMEGGQGSDTYFVDNVGDQVIEGDGAGIDGVNSSISFVLGQYFENLTLIGTAAIDGTGNDLDNVIIGNSGVNTLSGNGGSDTLDGGLGGDVLVGGIGSDRYIVDNAGDKVIEGNVAGIDKVQSSVSYSISGQFIENLTLTGTANINGTGNSLANTIVGNAASNTINGGLGADTMAGLAGSDSYYVDNIGDKVIEGNIAGVDKVYSTISYSLSGQYIENLTLTGSANIDGGGNSLANIVTGNAGSNVLNGGLGNDTLAGGAGADGFVFNTALGSTNVDKIVDFNVPSDAIWVDNAIFTALGANGLLAASAFHIGVGAHDANDRIIYNSATGALSYDSNGSAAGGSVQFATLSKGLAMTNADFLIV